jgi:hypothetical protein
VAAEGLGRVALPVKALKAGREAYWLDQIARNREEYFSGRGESPGRFVGSAATTAGLKGTASPEQVRAMFQGLDPATSEQRCAPLWRADPRSKLAAGPLLEALTARAAEQGVEDLEELAGSKALKGDMRSVQAACRLGGARRVKVETVERLCRKVLDRDPRELYGEGFEQAWQHKGKRVNERVQAFDHCFSSPKSVSLLAAASRETLLGEEKQWSNDCTRSLTRLPRCCHALSNPSPYSSWGSVPRTLRHSRSTVSTLTRRAPPSRQAAWTDRTSPWSALEAASASRSSTPC